MMQSALIIGGDSAIGSALGDHLGRIGVKTFATSRREGKPPRLDLAEQPALWPMLPKTDVAYLCAGATKLDACERDPESTARINVTHMQMLAGQLMEDGAHVVFLSTNQVFDGGTKMRRADEATQPRNEYGRQKAAMEAWLVAQNKAAAVLRLTKVITRELPVLAKWKEALLKDESVEAFSDMVMAPLPLPAVMSALELLGRQKPLGIFQISGESDVSYFDTACALATGLGKNTAKIISKRAADQGIPEAFLPPHTTLETSDIFAGISVGNPLKFIGIS